MNAIVFIAHGSKKELSNNEFEAMIEEIKKKNNDFDFIKSCFLEIAKPSIQDSANELIKNGVKNIYFYPFFLNSGKHVQIDIPNIIEELKKDNPTITFKILEHFGKSKYIEQIILKDISILL